MRPVRSCAGGQRDMRLRVEDGKVVLEMPESGSGLLGDSVARRLEALARSLGKAPELRMVSRAA